MEFEPLHWQPGSDEWHGDDTYQADPEGFGPAYGEPLDDRFDRHPEDEVSWPQSRALW